ncbi:hypothetical protein Xoosp13_230 [Xanthomonas phage Xoo-sp13]|nr:hypothetical protein Xoosp13_230 [Xanthomonas phage Xoo-sp13]
MSTPLTPEQIERDLKNVANFTDKNEKLSWSRRQKKIEQVVQEMSPLEEQIIALQYARQEILDKVFVMRQAMVKECIHPKNSLIHNGTHISCKFCNAKLSIPKER